MHKQTKVAVIYQSLTQSFQQTTHLLSLQTMLRSKLVALASHTGKLGSAEVKKNVKRAASTAVQFDWTDALNLETQLTDEEILMRDQVKSYCQQKLMPRILEANRHERPDEGVLKEMGDLGFLGPTIKGMSYPKLIASH